MKLCMVILDITITGQSSMHRAVVKVVGDDLGGWATQYEVDFAVAQSTAQIHSAIIADIIARMPTDTNLNLTTTYTANDVHLLG